MAGELIRLPDGAWGNGELRFAWALEGVDQDVQMIYDQMQWHRNRDRGWKTIYGTVVPRDVIVSFLGEDLVKDLEDLG